MIHLQISGNAGILLQQYKLINCDKETDYYQLTAFINSLNLAVDLARPLLDWISPQKAMKQNLNVLVAMLLDLGFLFLYGLAFVTLGKSGLSLAGVVGILAALGVGLACLASALLSQFALRRYPSIEA